MDIKQEVSISKNKIEEVKNKIKEIDIEIKKINSELLKDKHNNDLIEEKKDLLLEKHKLKELQEELESDLVIFAINNGYDVTTEDVAIILDSTTDFKDYVHRAKELGQKAICFSEHGNTYNWIEKKMDYYKG